MYRRSDPTDWMWAQACELIERAERMHRQFFRLASSGPARALWEPPADVFEDERELVIVVAMPGVVADRMKVVNEPGALVVTAERPLPLAGGSHVVRQLEIPYGLFERRIPLPQTGLILDATELSHGCLLVRLRKTDSLR